MRPVPTARSSKEREQLKMCAGPRSQENFYNGKLMFAVEVAEGRITHRRESWG